MTDSKEQSKPRDDRMRVTLPGKNGRAVTWQELAELEKQFGSKVVKEWMKGGTLVFPAGEPPEPKSEEFLRHMENLRRRAEQREYARMMEGAFPQGAYGSSAVTSYSPEHTGVGASAFQMGVIGMNMVIGIGCAYVAADYLSVQYGLTSIQRVSASLTAMIFVMMLEMLLFIIRASKFDELDNRKRKRMEATFAPAIGLGLEPSELMVELDPTAKKMN